MQVGIAIVAFEYERQREKKAAKKQVEAEENLARHEQARREHEVSWRPRRTWHELGGNTR